MGYALPSGIINSGSLFAFVTAAPAPLGPYVKQVGDQVLVVLDYQQASVGAGLTNYSFDVDVSTNPQLVISFPKLSEQAPKYTLSFLLSGGISEQQYNITITAHYTLSGTATQRVDKLIINIPSSGKAIQPVASVYSQLPLWGGGYVNSAVRAFWGPVPPVNPNVMDQWFNTTDDKLYEWITDGETALWVVIYASDYLTDSPHDGVLYGRLNSAWSAVPISEIQTDAPGDGKFYARQNHLWAAVPRIPQPSDTPPLMDAPVPVPGTSIDFARIDHVHPTDSTLYSASNPAGYQTAGNVNATLQAYMPLSGGVFFGAVSFNAAALFASPINLQIGGGNANYVLSTNGAGALSWTPPTVGLSDAPVNTQTYARSNGAWVNITSATGIPEAPNNGKLFARENLTWVEVPIGGGAGIPDAPNDSTRYARQNGSWQHITHLDITDWTATLVPYALTANVPTGSTIAPLMDASSPSTGTNITWARADHVHPTDTSRYSASNPANYISEAALDGTAYARKSATWVHLTHSDITDWVASTIPVTVSASPPASPQVGWLWWKTTDQQLYVWSGTAWVITVSPAVIPDAPNDGTAYARRSLSWSHLTHNDIADWPLILGNYLPLSGGVLTGQLNGTTLAMSSSASVTGQLSVYGAGAGAGSYTGYFDGTTTRKGYIGQFPQGMVWANDAQATNITLQTDGWIHLNGPVQGSSNIQATYLYSSGDCVAAGNMSCGTIFAQLSTGGTVTAAQLTSNGNLNVAGNGQVNGNFNCSNTVSGYSGNFSYSTIYGNLQVNGTVTGNGDINANRFVASSLLYSYGTAFVTSTLTVGGAISCSSSVTAAGDLNATGNCFSHGAFYCDAAGGGFFHRDAAGNFGMQIYCNTSNNIATWVNNRTGQNITMNASRSLVSSSDICAKPNAGGWVANSDKRIKNVLGRYKAGLKEVLQLNPMEYTFKGNDTDTRDGVSIRAELARDKTKIVGYVADDIMQVLPETVTLQSGFIDGKEVDDLKRLDMTNVTHALVNAMKEMYAEVQSLRAEVRALKAAA